MDRANLRRPAARPTAAPAWFDGAAVVANCR